MEKNDVVMFCVYHKDFSKSEVKSEQDSSIFYFGVNEIYQKDKERDNIILECELEKYNPFLQKRGYMETSAYLHVYWNNLHKDKEMIGFYQYDMKVNTNLKELQKDAIYILNSGRKIVKNGQWNHFMFPALRDLNFLINSYNKHFDKKYTVSFLEDAPLSLWQTNIYPIKVYEKLCKWLEVLIEEIYPWSIQPPYETHFGSIGGYTERALGIFNAFEIYEGIKYKNLEIVPIENNATAKEQYNIKSFLNNYSQDVHTKFIDNITGNYTDVNYCMFKAQCYVNGVYYTCERINKRGKNGLYFKTGYNNSEYIERAFDIEGEDPRIFTLNEKVYVAFICISPYKDQKRCIGITPFDNWNPVFLQVENMEKNAIEKNWAPFVKDDKLYFVYNYDPLVIISYDFNPQGICNVVFKQNNCTLPINTSNTYLRGGSNLIHYKDGYYIGGCHSRIFKKGFEHYTHIVLLNTNAWELVYVSKPIVYMCPLKDELNAWWTYPGYKKRLDMFNNILVDKTPNIIQDPISLYMKDEKFYMSINVRDCVSLLYELSFSNLFDFIQTNKNIGYYDNYVKETIVKI